MYVKHRFKVTGFTSTGEQIVLKVYAYNTFDAIIQAEEIMHTVKFKYAEHDE